MVYYYKLEVREGEQHRVYPVRCEEPIDLSKQPRLEGKDASISEITKDVYEKMVEDGRMK